MKRQILVGLGVLGSLAIAVAARTEETTPSSWDGIPYQGHLDSSGEPAQGSHDFIFTIHADGAPTTAPAWTERHEAVQVESGRFGVVLGEGVTTGGSFGNIWSLDRMFIGIQVCRRTVPETPCIPVVLSGRQRVLSVPNAVSSAPTGPIGQIMAMDFDAPSPDPSFWLESDGRAIPESSRLGRYLASAGRPLVTKNLTDDRFLMGAATSIRGGHNDGHGHGFSLSTGNPHGGSPLHSHTHGYTLNGFTNSSFETDHQTSRLHKTSDSTPRTGAPNNVDHTHSVNGTIGVRSVMDGDASGSNRPRFQAVRFFVKIN
jgi:hypothetical protein